MHGTQKSLKEVLQWKIEEMAKLRRVEIEKINFKTEELTIPMDHYGAVLAAVIFLL